jgi:hypothetical protein
MQERKDPAAVKLGRKGGRNSRRNLSDAEKKELAMRAANARWAKYRAEKGSTRVEKPPAGEKS